jgi:hypothetical protein
MQYTTHRSWGAFWALRVHGLVIISCLGLALLGQVPPCSAGWVTQPPVVYGVGDAGGVRRGAVRGVAGWRADRQVWAAGATSWHVPWLRSLALLLGGAGAGAGWLAVVPWLGWGWQVAGWQWQGCGGNRSGGWGVHWGGGRSAAGAEDPL